MDDRDYRSGSLNKEKQSHRGLWLGLIAVAVILAIAFFSFDRPVRDAGVSTDNTVSTTSSPATIEPAQGDTTPDGTATDTMDETAPAAPTQAGTSYATETECRSATGNPCHYVACDTTAATPDTTCVQGWQPVVPAPDQTNVPEDVSPPMNGQGTESAPTQPAPQ